MAYIKKQNARKKLEDGLSADPSVKYDNNPAHSGLRFQITIGAHTVSLTHWERDYIIAKWNEMEKEFN